MLHTLQSQRTTALRERLEQAGYVFDFVVQAVDEYQAPGEAQHREALAALFEAIQARAQRWQRQLIEREPKYAQHVWPDLSADLTQARAQALDATAIAALVQEGGALCRAFRDPPYGTPLQVSDFREWLQALRLHPEDPVQVFDWVGDPDINPGRSGWSDYFDDGKEWWGIWCLTIYNPRRRTLAALAASATD
ncbi:MAG: hypothetical protein GAK43_01562 [Stenotrophomonas maltophilia]|nr:MAG: hypothetical protein GAK43_01562 [Stenotrophomonas maltophilia]